MKTVTVLVILCITSILCGNVRLPDDKLLSSYKDVPYLQRTVQRFLLSNQPATADWIKMPFSDSVIQSTSFQPATDGNGEFLILTTSSLWLMDIDHTFHQISIASNLLTNARVRSLPPQQGFFGRIVLANPQGITLCDISNNYVGSCNTFVSSLGSVNDIIVTNPITSVSPAVWIGSENGLSSFDLVSHSIYQIPQIGKANITSVSAFYHASEERFMIAAGTPDVLWGTLPSGKWYFWRTTALIDAAVTSTTFDTTGTLWVGDDQAISQLHKNLTMSRVSGLQGLPMANITCLESDPNGGVWIGSIYGLARYHEGNWQYYYGPRWLPSRDFNSGQLVKSIGVSSLREHTILVATDLGMSLIRLEKWTLSKKAEHYQTMVHPRHDRYPGLVADVHLQTFGNISSYQQVSTDNDGLWTSIYLASQCFRYAVTKDPKVKKEAWHHFEALEFLNNATGIDGLMARSVLKQSQPPADGVWHNSTVYPGWIWKGDTSSDEVTGHMFIYPLVYHLLAESSAEKGRAKRLIYNIVKYIVENNYYLIDVTGKPTTWGVWAPEQLNANPTWDDERGLNSLQILSFIISAYSVTRDTYFLHAYKYLLSDENLYGINIINQKVPHPEDDNFSDDELAFLPYFTYLFAIDNIPNDDPVKSLLKNEFKLSITRAMGYMFPERSSLWNFIYGASKLSSDFDIDDSIWTLKTWPLSLIDWPVKNSNRKDIILNPDMSRSGSSQMLHIKPYDELSVYRWNADPFNLDHNNGGYNECDPGAWLLPYWMGRYYQFIV